jgi:ABC-2 type transport system ATP-binding protein
MNDSELVIQTRGLTRYFGRKVAVDQLNLVVPRGCVFGFLGRNGSGKTTTIRMILGLLDPTRGSARILGEDSRSLSPQLRARIGYMPENHPSYGHLSVRDNGLFQSRVFPRWNQTIFDAVIDYFRLDIKAKAKHLSRGERAGLSLALTLAPDPELLILDDPALGLDPVARQALLEALIQVTVRRDRTVLFSSHILPDVERVADHIAVLDQSVLRASCPVDVFRSHVRRFLVRYDGSPPPLPAIPGLLSTRRIPGEIRLTVANLNGQLAEIAAVPGVVSVEEVEVGLEDALISYLDNRPDAGLLLPDPAMGGVA